MAPQQRFLNRSAHFWGWKFAAGLALVNGDNQHARAAFDTARSHEKSGADRPPDAFLAWVERYLPR